MAAAKNGAVGDNRKELLRRLAFFDDVGNVMNIETKITAAQARVTELRNDRKKAIGLAKSRGHMAKTIEFAIAAQSAQDPKTFVDNFLHNGEVLEWCGLFPGFQSDLFRDRMPQDERITKAGELAGLTSRERSSGYAPDSQEDRAWLAAYDAAAKDRTEFLADALEAAAAPSQAPAKGKAGKKPKAKAGAPLTGDTPDSAKAADNDDKPSPPKPPKPDDDKTNAEKEAERQASAGFH